jgi:hypothetical protein
MLANVKWTRAYINRLPDTAFLYVDQKAASYKDDQGRSHPLDARHLPYRNHLGNIDLPHLRNAISRAPQTDLPRSVVQEVQQRARRLLEREQPPAPAALPMAANPTEVDETAANELLLYIENTAELMGPRSIGASVRDNLLRKMKRGRYDHALAPKAWQYVVDQGAKSYVKEFGGGPWHVAFNAATRREVAKELAESFKAEVDVGAYSTNKRKVTAETADFYRNRRRMSRNDEYTTSEILEGAAEGYFVQAWADAVEEAGGSFGGGQRIDDIAPAPPAEAAQLASQLVQAIEKDGGRNIADLYQLHAEAPGRHDREPEPREFGYYLAMQSVGHGVSWFDDHPEVEGVELRVPYAGIGVTVDPEDWDDATVDYFELGRFY